MNRYFQEELAKAPMNEDYLHAIKHSPYFNKELKELLNVEDNYLEGQVVKAPINALLSIEYADKINERERESLATDIYCICGNAFKYQRNLKEEEWNNLKEAFADKGIELTDKDKMDEYILNPSSLENNTVKSYTNKLEAYTIMELGKKVADLDVELDDNELEDITETALSQQNFNFSKLMNMNEFLDNVLAKSMERDLD